MTPWWLLPAASGASLAMTWVMRRYALTRRLIDVPNERSSHSIATPRGGGMAFALVFLGCLPLLWKLDFISSRSLAALGCSGAAVALIGFVDDHYHLSRHSRLLAHFLAAAWALYWLEGMPGLTIGSFELPAGWLCNAIATVYVVWLVNLYNFMDGIDAIASIEAITVCLGGVLLYFLVIPGGSHWIVPALLLAAVAGFLYWNYPPARIFMGDSGSGFLGMTLAIFSIQAAWMSPSLFWAWLIMLGVFIVDASVTLVRRMLAGGQIYLQAHCSHAYQHAAHDLRSHKPVSLAVGAINVLWLWPLAALVGLEYLNGMLGLLIAYVPLFALACYFKAGA